MNINELFDKFQEEFEEDELRGEFVLQGNVIIWSFNLSDEEELLIDAYHEDLEKIQLFLDELNEMENLNFSDYEIVDDVILLKIF